MSRLRLSFVWLVALAPSFLLLACGDDDDPSRADAGVAVRAVFRLQPDPVDFGAVPFPDDLYLRDGRVELGAFPGEERASAAMVSSLRESLREIDGFGVMSPVFFHFDGDIDPASLPESASASLADEASVFLFDADPASPSAAARVPVVTRWDPVALRLAVQPADGHPLREGTRYAAVVTSRVRAADGAAVQPAEAFASIRDASARPADPLEAEVYDRYAPVLASLATNGTPREDVVALAVFTVQSVGDDLEDARELVHAGEPPSLEIRRVVAAGPELDALLGTPVHEVPGGDVEGGVAHAHIAWVVDATFESIELASPEPGVHGRWTRDGTGGLVVKRRDRVWLTLVLPTRVDLASEPVPVVVFQHGLGGQRGNVFAIADTLCAAGFAVAAIDIPYHGMRASSAVDRRHTYGTTEGPDLYGDVGGDAVYLDFLGIADDAGELVAFHPFYVRDVLRQSVVDSMALVRLLREGDWSAVGEAGGPTFSVASGPMGFVGVSLGGILGTVFVASEPEIGAAVLAVTGGHLTRLVEMSPSFADTFLAILLPRLGHRLGEIDWERLPVSSLPSVAIYQTLLDRGDAIAHAPALAQRPVDLLLQMAVDDETVPNVATEALARALGTPIARAEPRYTDLETVTLPVSDNAMGGGREVTRALVAWSPANHGLLTSRRDARRWSTPLEPPFVRLDSPIELTNPIDAAQAQTSHFFLTWREGATEVPTVD